MDARIWEKYYPEEVRRPFLIDQNKSLIDLFDDCFKKYPNRPCITNMGTSFTFEQLDSHSTNFASYLQNFTTLKPGDRFALMLPNTLQYFIAAIGVLKAGLILVNTNPLYTARELEHQMRDCQVSGILVLENMAQVVEAITNDYTFETIITTKLGDCFSLAKKHIINQMVKTIKKMVPPFSLPQATPWENVMKLGSHHDFTRKQPTPDDIAMIQYTGGTTGVSKGAMLTHRNVFSNVNQGVLLLKPIIGDHGGNMITPLPLYHIFSSYLFICLSP